MTNQEIFDLIACFDRSTVQTLKLSKEDFTIELTRGQSAPVPVVGATPAVPVPTAAAAPAEVPAPDQPAITAPLVGTYYAAPAPDQPPFVSVGDHVSKGQTVCLMEAMKMMSKVPAPCDCVIEEVCRASGDLVAFGDALFRYRAV